MLALLSFFVSALKPPVHAQLNAAFSPAGVKDVPWAAAWEQPPPYGPSGPALLPADLQRTHDSAKFINGDRLTGTVTAIEDGEVSFALDLIEKTAGFPVHNFSELSFAGPPGSLPPRAGAIYLRDGSYLSAEVTGLTPDAVEARTLLGQPIAIPKSEVLGIGFYRSDDVLFQSDFSWREETRLPKYQPACQSTGGTTGRRYGEQAGFVPVQGSWRVEKGQFVQASPLPFCRAYVRLVQAGMVRYEWAVDLSASQTAALIFFASGYDGRLGESGYMVMLRGKNVSVHKILGERKQHGATGGITSVPPKAGLIRLRADYDPRSGEIVVQAGHELVIRLFDPNPIRRGEYVLLHSEGKAVFDDVRITHLVGTIEAPAPEGELDAVLLSNGDRVSGKVVGLSRQLLLKNPYSPAESPIERGRVRSITFASSGENPPTETRPLPRTSLWNGDVLLGEIVRMDEEALVLSTSFLPELTVARGNLRSIAFPEASPAKVPRPGGAGRRYGEQAGM
jgi:hypothetical protein